MVLHLVNNSHSALQQCLHYLGPQDSLLLIQDGVFASAAEQALIGPYKDRVYALEDDLQQRGLDKKAPDWLQRIGYSGFVELTVSHAKTQSWF